MRHAESSVTDRNSSLPPVDPPRFRSYAELLATCRERYVDRIGSLLETSVEQIDAALQARRRAAAELSESLSLLETQYQLRAMARGLRTKFRRSFEDSFRRRTEPAPAGDADADESCLLPAFGLSTPADIEVAPEVIELSAPLIEATSAELAELRPRVAWLTGHETLDDKHDPLGPVAICEAVLELCSELAGAAENRALIKQMLMDSVRTALAALFAETSAQLAASNVPPTAGRSPAPAGDLLTSGGDSMEATTEPAAPQQPSRPAPAHSGTALQQALAGSPPGAATLSLQGRDFPLTHGTDALENILRNLLTAGIGERLDDDERMIVDVVASLFDYLFDSASIPRPIKLLLARLQLPILRLALADHDFFADRQHPARRLLNLLALAGATWDGEITPDSALHREASRLIVDIERHSARDSGVFARARQTLETWLAEQERMADERAATLTDKLVQRERVQIATREAEAVVAPIRADSTLPESLRQFAGGTWVKVLTHAQQAGGSNGPAWREATAALQDLVWSVQPKYDTAERARLARLLKPLLETMRACMDRAGIDSETRDAFFTELVRLHAAAVKAGMSGAPARQVAYRGDAEPEPDPGGEFEVDMLGRGDWIELREQDGSVRRVRLTWISPARTLYLFANRQGQRAVALTREELARRFTTGEATAAGEDTLLGRIVDDALDRHGNES
ncbi:DUF1631 family protein [Thauera sedimentorum]|uniref:DUF1631 family protein n=1 Tax=Thauera sedimentorum TaxID=2767595 RepID=UPI001CDBFC05|nr:DUF1631 family protein [Thauera sedimentorum]